MNFKNYILIRSTYNDKRVSKFVRCLQIARALWFSREEESKIKSVTEYLSPINVPIYCIIFVRNCAKIIYQFPPRAQYQYFNYFLFIALLYCDDMKIHQVHNRT